MTRLLAVVGVIPLAVAVTAATGDPVGKCLPCVDLFSKLEAGADGRLSQVVEIQQRGEPKSGTHMMGNWAREVLRRTCVFLGSMYGSETCTTTTTKGRFTQLHFNPQMSRNGSTCSCDTIDR